MVAAGEDLEEMGGEGRGKVWIGKRQKEAYLLVYIWPRTKLLLNELNTKNTFHCLVHEDCYKCGKKKIHQYTDKSLKSRFRGSQCILASKKFLSP